MRHFSGHISEKDREKYRQVMITSRANTSSSSVGAMEGEGGGEGLRRRREARCVASSAVKNVWEKKMEHE